MRQKALIVHLNTLPGVAPLVGGYLKAYAEAQSDVRNHWDVELYSAHIRTPASQILQHLVDRAPRVIGFSVYTWNVALMQRLLPALRGLLPPDTQYLLGGVEVMHCGQRYVEATWDNVAVCNGEGEETFSEYLMHLEEKHRGLETVRGLSFYRDGEWLTTEARPRIADLDQIPSPWLSGAIDFDGVEVVPFETNRGCPFACEFCFWGGAIGQKLHRLGYDRIKDEIDYVTSHPIKTLWLIDANFGILPRDVEIAEHIVAMKKARRSPHQVIFSSSKNTIDRVEEVSRILSQGGLLTSQPISLQSMDERALRLAKRDNIKTEVYLRLQRRLNEWGVPSYVELIWPLPGETLDSFKRGIEHLCTSGAQAFSVYPHLWLNNVGFRARTAELGVVTLKEDDAASGAEMVIQTNEVSYNEYTDGLLFSTGLYLLHDCRGLYLTMQLLHALGLRGVRDVLDDFVTWMKTASRNHIVDLWRDGEEHFEQTYKYPWRGAMAIDVLHRHRQDFDVLLESFTSDLLDRVTGVHGNHADLVRAAVEFDLLARPYVYVQTPMKLGVALKQLRISEQRRGIFTIESPFDFAAIVGAVKNNGEINARLLEKGKFEITIDHRPGQVLLPSTRSEEHLYWHLARLLAGGIRHAATKTTEPARSEV